MFRALVRALRLQKLGKYVQAGAAICCLRRVDHRGRPTISTS